MTAGSPLSDQQTVWNAIRLLPDARQSIYAYYSLQIAQDGTPMKKLGRATVFSPILAPYLVWDFVAQHERSGSADALRSAILVAERSTGLASPYARDSLVYWYDPALAPWRMPTGEAEPERAGPGDGTSPPYARPFYSGLTQAWYVRAFARLARLESRFASRVGQFYRSLTVPIREGGPLVEKDFGSVIEEYPFTPPLYTLNGWLTAIRWLLEQEEVLAPLDGFAGFIERNLSAVQHLLPLYDVPLCSNSRYQLSGPSRLRLVFSKSVHASADGLRVKIPGEGTFEGDVSGRRLSRWSSHLERNESRLMQFNVLLSMAAYPRQNEVTIELSVDRPCEVTCLLADGDYDPLLTAMPTRRWLELSRLQLGQGRSVVTVPIPYDGRNLFAYPTNFKKAVQGKAGMHFNAYHFVHVMDLAVLYSYSGIDMFKEYALKWLRYIEDWPRLPFLGGNRFSYQHYSGAEFAPSVQRYLASRRPS